MIHCRIKQENVDDAQHQLEFLAEVSESQGKTAEHYFLEALVEWRKKGNKTEAIKLLDNCLNLHIAQTKTATSNIDNMFTFTDAPSNNTNNLNKNSSNEWGIVWDNNASPIKNDFSQNNQNTNTSNKNTFRLLFSTGLEQILFLFSKYSF